MSLTKKENFDEWLVQWGERYAYVYAKKRRLEYTNTAVEGMQWLALWTSLYVIPYIEKKKEEEEKKQAEEREKIEAEKKRIERECYLFGSRRKDRVDPRRKRVIIDPLDERLTEEERLVVEKEYEQTIRLKAKTIAEQELAANRWLREWRIENNIRRRWEFNDEGYESTEEEQ